MQRGFDRAALFRSLHSSFGDETIACIRMDYGLPS